MNDIFYIPRTLHHGGKRVSEQDFFADFKVIIVLAEPGGGKTALLQNVARLTAVTAVRASGFMPDVQSDCLIVDALDEVSRLAAHDISPLLKEIRSAKADRIVLASRSGEWEEADTRKVAAILGVEPKVAHLLPLDEQEQRALFAHEFPAEGFDAFSAQVHKFDLQYLLGNPEFLKLFAAAYIESGRNFKDRHSIFEDAVKHLASEANKAVPQRNAPPRNEKISWADEVFAKLMLSGADGVTIAGTPDEERYPQLSALGVDARDIHAILDTKLFKPARIEGQHEPVHRIVAEYCAARHLNKLIADNTSKFSARQGMAMIAPNGVTRDELRGLLGWLAALGSQQVQDLVIATDPYAVLANGDPSLLTPRSKKRLIEELLKLEAVDPYFRRSDRWRSFSASGFFTADVVEEVRRALTAPNTRGHLRGLLLELLDGSQAAGQLQPELATLMLDPQADSNIRALAANCLVSSGKGDIAADVDRLIAEGSPAALKLACRVCANLDALRLDPDLMLRLLQQCTSLYPPHNRRETTFEPRYFIKRLIRLLDLAMVEALLDKLTAGLTCTCDAKHAHECNCRNGISKIVGMLLDRHFELAIPPHDAQKVYNWLRNLNFHRSIGRDDSTAVQALQGNDELRRAIQTQTLAPLTDRDQIYETYFGMFMGHGHSGLAMTGEDQMRLADLAFETDNIDLWSYLMPSHRYYDRPAKGKDPARTVFHSQAKQKPAFLARWAQSNRLWKMHWEEMRDRRGRFESRRRRRERKIQAANNQSLVQDKAKIERGEHSGWLERIASLYLIQPNELDDEFGGRIDFEQALRNALYSQAQHAPSLQLCAKHSNLVITRILYAGCLAEFRVTGRLDGVAQPVLQAVKTDSGGYNGMSEDELTAFSDELDRNLFTGEADREQFLRGFIEEQLAYGRHSDVGWLDYRPEFHRFRSTLPMKWLNCFPQMTYESMDCLFDICARHGDRAALCDLIKRRSAEAWDFIGPFQPGRDARVFWFLRHFYFVEGEKPEYWHWLAADPNTIFALEHNPGRRRDGEDTSWPDLTAAKVAQVLDAFVDKWPPVPLPSSWGTGSPEGETAYRYLTNVVWVIGRDDPNAAIPVLDALLSDARFSGFEADLRSIRASSTREQALRNFRPPSPEEVVKALADSDIVSVEHMRALLLEKLNDLQADLKGGDLDEIETYYDGGKRVSENAATKRIASWLRPRLHALDISDAIEHQMRNAKRCDFTAAKVLGGQRRLLVTEVKGQWNPELFSAASAQLYDRYAIHPDAEYQGIYLVLWFGGGETIAGRKQPSVTTAQELKTKVEASIPEDLRGFIDVFVLDLSK